MVGYGGCCKGEKRKTCGGFDAEGGQGERMSGFLPKGHRAGPSHWIPGSTLLKRSSGLTTADSLGPACSSSITCPLSSHSGASTFGPRMLQLPWSRSRTRSLHSSPPTPSLIVLSHIRHLPCSPCNMLLPRAHRLARLPFLTARSYASSSTHSTLNVPIIGSLDTPTSLFMLVAVLWNFN